MADIKSKKREGGGGRGERKGGEEGEKERRGKVPGCRSEVDVDVSIEVGDTSRGVVVGETPATKHKRGEKGREVKKGGEKREMKGRRRGTYRSMM